MYLSTKIYKCISRLFILYVHHAFKKNDATLMQSVSVKSTSANLGTPPWTGITVSHKIQ